MGAASGTIQSEVLQETGRLQAGSGCDGDLPVDASGTDASAGTGRDDWVHECDRGRTQDHACTWEPGSDYRREACGEI